MSVQDKLNQVKSIKDEIKQILQEKGMITDSTPFSEYASIIETMIVSS